MNSIPLSREHFDYPPRIGDTVRVREEPKFKVRRSDVIPFPKTRSLNYMVISLAPLLAKPVSLVVSKYTYGGELISMRTRVFK